MKVWLNLPARWSQFTIAHQSDFDIFLVSVMIITNMLSKNNCYDRTKKINAINPLLPSCAIKKEHSILWQLDFFEQSRGFNILWQLEEEEEAGSKGSSSIKQSRHNATPLPPPQMPPPLRLTLRLAAAHSCGGGGDPGRSTLCSRRMTC